jgi:CDP-diacylglycerol--glycerol-3-phosphate 3-phosphatidyltransferase
VRITANQVTWLRLLLLPLPVAMLYQGGKGWMLGALAVYILLGLTDALDGVLARRYGSTPLGALLDPIVDKIFLVATYIPLADHQIISTVYVSLMFVREISVTALRSIAIEEQFGFRTSRVAKLKTTVQMVGAGMLLLVWMFPRDAVIVSILGAIAAGSLLPLAGAAVRGTQPGWGATWGAGLFVSVALTRVALTAAHASMVIMSVILVFTLLSGLEYFWGMRRVLAARFRRRPIDALRLAGPSLAVPALLVPAIELPGGPAGLIMGILAAELAVGGLDNSLVHAGGGRGPGADLLRSAIQGAAGVCLLVYLPGGTRPPVVAALAWAALGVTLVDLGVRLLLNGRQFRMSGARAAAELASAPEVRSMRSR